MRRKVAVVLLALSVISFAVFALAPVIYSPLKFTVCPSPFAANGCYNAVLVAYESPSCALLGVGAAMGVSMNSSVAFTRNDPIGYHIECPPLPSGPGPVGK
jgi:hypothetical protein